MEFGNLEHRNIRGPISMIREMVRGCIFGVGVAIIMGLLLRILDMDLGKCIGKKDRIIRESGLRECSMEKEKFGIKGK